MRRGQREPDVCLYQADGSGLDACVTQVAGSVVLFLGNEDRLSELLHGIRKQSLEVPVLAFGGSLRQQHGRRDLIHANQNLCVSTADSLIGNKKPMKLDFISFLTRRGMNQVLTHAEIQAWTIGSLIEETLIRAGTELSRLGFVEAIEQIRYFHAGPSMPLTFSRTQKLGSQGAYITCPGEGQLLLETWVSVIR
jgi:hypothetical protein